LLTLLSALCSSLLHTTLELIGGNVIDAVDALHAVAHVDWFHCGNTALLGAAFCARTGDDAVAACAAGIARFMAPRILLAGMTYSALATFADQCIGRSGDEASFGIRANL
jgi:hypothetical protein